MSGGGPSPSPSWEFPGADGPRCPSVTHFHSLQGWPLLQFHPLLAGTSPLLKVFTGSRQFPPNSAQFPSWLAHDVRFYPRPKFVSPSPISFLAKTDGPNWAADAGDTPNPARIGSPDPPDRFIRSCFVAIG